MKQKLPLPSRDEVRSVDSKLEGYSRSIELDEEDECVEHGPVTPLCIEGLPKPVRQIDGRTYVKDE